MPTMTTKERAILAARTRWSRTTDPDERKRQTTPGRMANVRNYLAEYRPDLLPLFDAEPEVSE